MTDTLATQADTDAATHAAYLANGENKAATARELGINASTVADRIKRHLARTAQDEATEPQPPAEQPYQVIAAETDSGPVEITRFARIDISEPETGDAVDEYAAQMRAETDAALGRGEDTYTGTACPSCHAVAYAFKGGHQVGCRYHKLNAPGIDTADDPEAQAARDALMDQACGDCGVEVDFDGAKVEHLDNCPAGAVIDPEIAGVLAAGLTGGLAAAAERVGEVLANAAEVTPEPAPAPAKAERVTVTECVRCGFAFSRPQTRTTCQSDKACQRRQAARVAA